MYQFDINGKYLDVYTKEALSVWGKMPDYNTFQKSKHDWGYRFYCADTTTMFLILGSLGVIEYKTPAGGQR